MSPEIETPVAPPAYEESPRRTRSLADFRLPSLTEFFLFSIIVRYVWLSPLDPALLTSLVPGISSLLILIVTSLFFFLEEIVFLLTILVGVIFVVFCFTYLSLGTGLPEPDLRSHLLTTKLPRLQNLRNDISRTIDWTWILNSLRPDENAYGMTERVAIDEKLKDLDTDPDTDLQEPVPAPVHVAAGPAPIGFAFPDTRVTDRFSASEDTVPESVHVAAGPAPTQPELTTLTQRVSGDFSTTRETPLIPDESDSAPETPPLDPQNPSRLTSTVARVTELAPPPILSTEPPPKPIPVKDPPKMAASYMSLFPHAFPAATACSPPSDFTGVDITDYLESFQDAVDDFHITDDNQIYSRWLR